MEAMDPEQALSLMISARLIQSALRTADAHFVKSVYGSDGMNQLRAALVALANLLELERQVRSMYREHQDLGRSFKTQRKHVEFAAYLRNKLVGHLHADLVTKAVEWRPELRYLVHQMADDQIALACNMFVLETAINTFVDEDERHKIFGSDTDLMYPPDSERFIRWLERTNREAMAYLDGLSGALAPSVERPEIGEFDPELWKNAGQTTFSYLRKDD